MALVYKKCEADDIHQLIPAHDIGYMFTMLHRNSWLQDNVLRPGLKAEYHYIDQGWSCDIPNILFRMPDKMVIISQLNYGGSGAAWTGLKSNDKFAARISGVLMVNEPGSYQFKVTANDAAAVYLSHKKVPVDEVLGRDGVTKCHNKTRSFIQSAST
ncbi:ANKRD50 [Symbiodinium sp. KB8]|nr:ANKRD50 [Symbiodinium sp. KB8]